MGSKIKEIHHGYRYRNWRDTVLENGNYRCCKCGVTEDLTADHIKPISTNPELGFDVENGRVLCNSCRVEDMLEGVASGRFKKSRERDNGKYGFLVSEPILYSEPIPCKGKLSFFIPEPTESSDKKKLICKKTNISLEMMGFEQLNQCVICDDGCEDMENIMAGLITRRQGVISGK